MISVTIPAVNKLLGTFSKCCRGPAVCILGKEKLIANFTKRNDGIVKVCTVKTGECKKFQLSSLKLKKEEKYYNAVKALYFVMSQTYNSLPSFDIDLDGDMLECEGSMTFAAIALATLKAIDQTMGLHLCQEDLVSIVNSALVCIAVSGNYTNLLTMLNAKEDEVLLFNGLSKSYEVYKNPLKVSGYSLLTLDGHVPVSALKEEAMYKDAEIREANQVFMDMYVGCNLLTLSNNDFRDKIEEFDEDVKRYCRYLFEESKAALSIMDIVKNRDSQGIKRLFEKIKKISEDNLEFICPEINWIIKRVFEIPGCLGACMTFSGFKTKIALICKNESIPLIEALSDEYQRIFGFPISAEIFGK